MKQPQDGSDNGVDAARAFIEKAEWTFAKSMPWHPHEYVAKRRCFEQGLGRQFTEFARLIDGEGFWRQWGDHRWRSLRLDDHIYWLHWELWPVEQRTIINRWWTDRMAPDSGQLTMEVD